MKKNKKKFSIIISIIIVILVITNPSLKNFKEFIPSQKYIKHSQKYIKHYNFSKEKNFIIFSVLSFNVDYKVRGGRKITTKKITYIGFFKNFIKKNEIIEGVYSDRVEGEL